MQADLTVDNLCKAVAHFLQGIAAQPDQPINRERGLVLWGEPADDTMKTLMEVFGGVIRITVREIPPGMTEERSRMLQELSGAGGQTAAAPADLWHPEPVAVS